MPSDSLPPPLPPKPSLSLPLSLLHSLGSPRRSQPRVNGQGEGPRGCRQRGPSQKWHFSALLGLFSRPPAPHPRCPPVDALVGGARLWEESLRFVTISRDWWGGRWGRLEGTIRWPSPHCVLRGCWRRILQVTARSRLSVLTPKPERAEGGREARGPFLFLSGDLVRSDFFFLFLFFLFLFKRTLSHHLACPAPR